MLLFLAAILTAFYLGLEYGKRQQAKRGSRVLRRMSGRIREAG